jgi:predicted AlkP superfamily pyrophosphatase or phosphodiesterase
MKKIAILLAVLIGFQSCSVAQSSKKKKDEKEETTTRRPKLIIGITIDQMRYDYIEKYWDDFGNDGFKKLVNDGFFARNLHYNYMPTYTAAGHAAIYTGTTPAYNGILANDWYLRDQDTMIYCTGDGKVRGIGTSSSSGKMSPHRLISTTIGDELKLFSNQRSKVIGISMKDRGAILPAGRTADAAYWFIGGTEGNWVTSSWYMDSLPNWVSDYNKTRAADKYINGKWELLLSPDKYDESMEDNNAYELPFKGTTRPAFPYDLAALRELNGNYDLLKSTPFANTLTTDFAKAVIANEKLGKGKTTDMLCVSYSGTDYVGHQFGIHSKEAEDTYIRLDLEIAALIKYLDEKVGKGEYLLFLTADHAGVPTPSYHSTFNASAGYWKSDRLEEKVNEFLTTKYGPATWIVNETNQNIFLNRTIIREKNLDLKKIQIEVAQFVSEQESVLMAFNGSDLDRFAERSPIASHVQLGYSQRYSGDVIYVLNPGYMEYGMQGTTHGSPYTSDTHVPAIFYGFGVKKGESYDHQTICDIAPTVTSICKLPLPNACIGEPIKKLVK